MDIKDVLKFANNEYSVLVKPNLIDNHPFSASIKMQERKAIKESQKKLKHILENIIINKGKLSKSKELDHFIEIGNNIIKKYRVESGRLIENNEINELSLRKAFLLNYPVWLIDIISTFIKFLLHSEKYLRKIKKCNDCKKYFYQSKLYKYQKYCSICTKKNHTPKDIQAERTQRSRNAAKKRKDKDKRELLYKKEYKRLIKEGHPMNKAKEFAELIVIEQLSEIE
ncbi:MAG: hypothetical protein JW976_15680 [Syntrophaceae bacterium]|nr:hypothetical protein [Syntrophaceae bacterium]